MRFLSATASAVLSCLALAACVSAPEPAPAPVPVPTPTPRPTPVPTPSPVPTYSSWMDVPATPGDWTYEITDLGASAYFRTPGLSHDQSIFSISCRRQSGMVTLGRQQLTSPSDFAITVRTETQSQRLPANVGFANTEVHATLAARDSLLDAMAFSKGRFAIEVVGSPTLYIPSYPEVTRVIEDCR